MSGRRLHHTAICNLVEGEVSEWFMVPLSKSGLRYKRSVDSNPTLSATQEIHSLIPVIVTQAMALAFPDTPRNCVG